MSDKKTSLFHDLPEELRITAIMCVVKEDTATRKLNTNAMDIHRNTKQEMDNLARREGLEKANDEFIQCVIYRKMWDSDRRWKKNGGVKKEVIDLKFNKDKDSGLKENFKMHYKGLGQVEAKTTWSKNGKKKTIPELPDCLIEIIKLTKQWNIPDETHMTAT